MINGKFTPAESMRVTEQGVEAAMSVLLERVKAEPNLEFIQEFHLAHPEARIFLVGGAVRDQAMGVESKDFDFVIEGVAQGAVEEFLDQRGKIRMDSDRTLGIYLFVPEGSRESYDVALTRVEKSDSGSRKPKEVVTGSVPIEDDLGRRDFTINALALDLFDKSSRLVDPYGGIRGIQERKIDAVGDPRERFLEDPLRMMRAIRFACKLDFEIDPATFGAIKELAPEINRTVTDQNGRSGRKVSYERISWEMKPAIERDPLKFYELTDRSGIAREILPEVCALHGVEQPEVFHSEGDVWEHTKLVLASLPPNASLSVKLAALLHDIGKPATFRSAKETGDRIRFHGHETVSAEMAAKILERYRFEKDVTKEIIWLIENHMKLLGSFQNMSFANQKKFVRQPLFENLLTLSLADAHGSVSSAGESDTSFLTKVNEIKEIVAEETAQKKPLMILRGDQVLELLREEWPEFDNKKQAMVIGKILNAVNDSYQEGEFTTVEEAVERAKREIAEHRRESAEAA